MIKFEHLTLSQKIAETIASQIVEGTLKPGERLIENELSELFGTSRSPIREALYILENQGIVERMPRKGVLVKNYSKKEVFDLYYVVYNLTEMALEKGMETYTEEQLAILFELIEQMEKTIESREIKKCFLLIEQLHMKLFELPNNKVLEDLYHRVNMRWTTFRYLSLSHPDSLKRSIYEYKEIIVSLKEKDFSRIPPILEMKKSRALSVLEKLVAE